MNLFRGIGSKASAFFGFGKAAAPSAARMDTSSDSKQAPLPSPPPVVQQSASSGATPMQLSDRQAAQQDMQLESDEQVAYLLAAAEQSAQAIERAEDAGSLSKERKASTNAANSLDDSDGAVDSSGVAKSQQRKRKASLGVPSLTASILASQQTRLSYAFASKLPLKNLRNYVEALPMDLRVTEVEYDRTRIEVLRDDNTSVASVPDTKEYTVRLLADSYAYRKGTSWQRVFDCIRD
jgi:hypothetical protein